MPVFSNPPRTIGLAALSRIAFRGGSFDDIIMDLAVRFASEPQDAAALFDLGTILQLSGKRKEGLDHQREAIAMRPMFRQPATRAEGAPLTLLMLATPGDFMANTPVQFLLEDSEITLDVLYVMPGGGLPNPLPQHDVMLVGISESDDNRETLASLPARLKSCPRPVLNQPRGILDLSRERLYQLLSLSSAIDIPPTIRIDRETLNALCTSRRAGESLLPEIGFPIIARPIGSHAGIGLQKLDDGEAVLAYLATHDAALFYISPFVDFRSSDNLFRKYRIAFIDGRPYACHAAIGANWMLHYLNAGMAEDPAKRADEARFMADFDTDFALRHQQAFADLVRLVGLDYFAIDCAETRDGKLLIFEADVAMIVHDMDDPAIYPYKGPQMAKVFSAFRQLVRDTAAHGLGGPHGWFNAA